MSTELKFVDTQEKLDKLCNENHLEVSFKRDDFPIVFHFTPLWEKAAQMRLDFADGDPDGPRPTDPDASIDLIFGDELVVQITKDFTIDDDVLNKLKGAAKKLHYLYLQIYHRRQMEAAQRYREAQKQADAAYDIGDTEQPNDGPLLLEGRPLALPEGSTGEQDEDTPPGPDDSEGQEG